MNKGSKHCDIFVVLRCPRYKTKLTLSMILICMCTEIAF